MEAKYDAYWYDREGDLLDITHGTLTEEDIREAIERKEDRQDIRGIPVKLVSHTIESVEL